MSLEFSIWEPQTLFSSPLFFSLDWISWPLIMAGITILLVISLTFPSRDVVITVQERISTLLYLCMTLAAILAGNMLSVVIAWMLMDVFVFTLGMVGADYEDDGSEVIKWFAKNLISIFLLLIAIVLDLSKGGVLSFGEQMSGISVVIVILSVFLRMPIYSIEKVGKKIGWIDPGNLAIIEIFPALSGFSLLGNILTNGISADAITWVRLFGGLFLILSLVRYVLRPRIQAITSVLYIGVFGVGILAASYQTIETGILFSSIGVLISSLYISMKYLPIHESWHTVFQALLIGMLAGLPGTLGGVIGSRTANEIISSGNVGIAIFVLFGMGSLTGISTMGVVLSPVDWKNSENLTRISYAVGTIFLVINGVIIGMELNQDVSLQSLVFFLSVTLIAGLFYYFMTKMRYRVMDGIGRYIKIPHFKIRLTGIIQISHHFFRILSGIGDILESENGMLWALVILQLIILAMGKFGI